MRRFIFTLLLLMQMLATAFAQTSPDSDSISVSVVTCAPGSEIFELYGHEALWVRGPGIDEVYNYGLFDFSSPGFVTRFVKGETDYMSGCVPMAWFIGDYVQRGSRVTARRLNLSQQEARRLHNILRRNTLPENTVYRYKYLSRNCATRILDDIDEALDAPVAYPDVAADATYREQMRTFNRNYPWYQFGIDLALGSEIDRPMSARQKMFVPVVLERGVAQASRPDGTSLLTSDAEVLFEGIGDATLPPTPFLLSPLFWSWVVFLLALVICACDLRRGRTSRWFYTLWYLVTGLAGLLIFFLVFISVHEGTSPNLLAWWLNPLCLLVPGLIWWRSASRLLAVFLTAYSVVVVVILLTSPWVAQSYNSAFYPLMLTSLVTAVAYTIIHYKKS